MWMNLLVILFVGLAGYWWSVQGLFNAFLHLMAIIVAGALAFAVWEPLAHFLLAYIPDYAWSVGLVGPFIFLVILVRVAIDVLVLKNMRFDERLSKAGGFLCGVCAGTLVAGVCLLGISFGNLPSSFMGYQPFVLQTNGVATKSTEGDLWYPVDRMTASFFSRLSTGAFRPINGDPLATYLPNLYEQAGTIRLRVDSNSSTVSEPELIRLTDWWMRSTPLELLSPTMQQSINVRVPSGGQKLVVADISYAFGEGLFDPDRTLRIYPTQVRLVSWSRENAPADAFLHAPIGLVEMDHEGKNRAYVPIDDSNFMRYSTTQQGRYGWVFLIPGTEHPKFLMVRRLRLPLPKRGMVDEPTLVAALGRLPLNLGEVLENQEAAEVIQENAQHGRGNVASDAPLAQSIGVTTALPNRVSRVQSRGLTYNEDGLLVSGDGEASPPLGSQRVVSDSIAIPPQFNMVRVGMTRDQVRATFGRVMLAGGDAGAPVLKDSRGLSFRPMGWIHRKPQQVLRVNINPATAVTGARELPVDDMQEGDILYLYFMVEHGITITSFEIGSMKQPLDLQVP